ncbi:MAG: ROK family protein [Dehalococcoidales bacterium]|jgi:glucokinase
MGQNETPLVAAVDLGGSKILSVVADAHGNIISRDLRKTSAARGPEAVIDAILESLRGVISEAGVSASKLCGIGLGAPGVSNPETGVVFTSPNLPGWHDVPLRDIIARETGLKTLLINDANAAALGELCFGAARGVRNFIYITISTGIGGGIVINGELYGGASGTAGEIGHMTIADDGPPCTCGNRGCWEQLASGTALAREARRRIGEGAASVILECAGGNIERVTAEAVSRALDRGDALAAELVAQTSYYLGVGFANLINIFNPELIVIGGGLSNMGEKLLSPAYQVAGQRAFKESYRAVRFARAELGADAGVLGAAALILGKENQAIYLGEGI